MIARETGSHDPRRGQRRSLPVVILTAKNLTEEDRRRLNGSVERVIQKGDRSREALLNEIRESVAQCVGGRPVPTAA